MIGDSKPGERGKVAYDYVQSILGNDFKPNYPKTFERNNNNQAKETKPVLEENHKYNPRFGDFGGQYVPEALHTCLAELEKDLKMPLLILNFGKNLEIYIHTLEDLLLYTRQKDYLNMLGSTNLVEKRRFEPYWFP